METVEPFVWERRTGEHGGRSWDDIDIADCDCDLQRGHVLTIPVSRLAEFEAFVKQIREEVEG